ncbi:MAG: ATP-binding cassette domain-containing protein, partial [Saprospiraceae bacterium]|nr:ATP-binding cassette domain-containing protein [Saprospiraceae bacterium]
MPLRNFPFYRQLDAMDCGPTCLRMVAAHYGKHYPVQYLRERSYIDREGVSLRGIVEAAESIGIRTLAVKLPLRGSTPEENGLADAPLPCIVHWRQRHFVVVYKINRSHVWIADPAAGKMKLPHADFLKNWVGEGNKGIALLLEPTPEFYTREEAQPIQRRRGLSYLLQYLRPFRGLLWQLVAGLMIVSVFQLIFPFLTQAIVDKGVDNQDLGFVTLILFAQLALFLGQMTANFIQSWILLHIGARVNIALISDFLAKLMRLPIGFFDTKMTGDLLQRIGDHRRIEVFLTGSTLNTLFSLFSLVIFGLVLAIYHPLIFFVFLFSAALYFSWILLFLRKRAQVDHLRFREQSENQNALIELIQGMQEIKLQRSERKRRWQWAHIQARLFRVNVRSLAIVQYQDAGALFINQLKDILITFIAARAVIGGDLTLGMMLAIQYIVGQMNAPLSQLISFIRAAQDARISLERMSEIHEIEEETAAEYTDLMPSSGDLQVENVSFQYNPLAPMALKDISLTVPQGKITAIVGASGSGKTTLIKLLLGFYQPTQGIIRVGKVPLSNVDPQLWRSQCGAVMQDGFIFSDSIANNIAESED